MATSLFNYVSKICSKINLIYFFCILNGIFIICFIVYIFLVIKSSNKNAKLKHSFIVLAFIFTILVYGVEFFAKTNLGFWILQAIISSIFTFVILLLPQSQVKFDSGQISLARFFSDKVKQQQCGDKGYQNQGETYLRNGVEKLKTQQVSLNDTNTDNNSQDGAFCQLNFSHVKNIIERLNYFSLNQADKKQVHDLEVYIAEAENSGFNNQLKTKINDSLGGLLKIMSKYGV